MFPSQTNILMQIFAKIGIGKLLQQSQKPKKVNINTISMIVNAIYKNSIISLL